MRKHVDSRGRSATQVRPTSQEGVAARARGRALRIAAHLTVVLALAFGAFLVLDYFNPLMSFVSNEVSTPLLGLFCASSLVVALALLRRGDAGRTSVRGERGGGDGASPRAAQGEGSPRRAPDAHALCVPRREAALRAEGVPRRSGASVPHGGGRRAERTQNRITIR